MVTRSRRTAEGDERADPFELRPRGPYALAASALFLEGFAPAVCTGAAPPTTSSTGRLGTGSVGRLGWRAVLTIADGQIHGEVVWLA